MAPALESREVQVWVFSLEEDATGWSKVLSVLSRPEQDRARSFQREADAARFAILRAQLRLCLAQQLSSEPSAICLEEPPGGKPRVAGNGVHFSVAHSGARGVLAFSRSFELGVDVEEHRAVEFAQLSETFFGPEERR